MKYPTCICTVILIALYVSLWPIAGHASSGSNCTDTFVAAGQRTVTPAEVTGAPQERLTLHRRLDENGSRWVPLGGYLLTGDKVEMLTSCEGYDYVRFHGAKRISVGWVEASRIRTTGAAFVPLPANAVALCRAAEETLNHGGQLQEMATTDFPEGVLKALDLEPGWNASPPKVARMNIGGRALAATSIDSGGTCHSSTVTVLSGDLQSTLSPADRDDRDIENDGADSWEFGVNEGLVTVLGQPMVLSSVVNSKRFFLSTITRDGDIVPTCEGGPVALDKRRLVSGDTAKVCHAVLDGKQTSIALNPQVDGHSISLDRQPDSFRANPVGPSDSTAPILTFHDDARAADVAYALVGTAQADIDNTGKVRSVGLVTFDEDGSTAGCGDFQDSQVIPVYLDKQGRADPSSAMNQGIAEALPHDMKDGRFVSYTGRTYIELSPDKGGLSSEVWEVGSQGPKQVCAFALTHFVVRPISEDGSNKPSQ